MFLRRRACCAAGVLQRDRRLIADRPVRADLVVVSEPILHLCPRIGKRQEPVGVQALAAEPAVERLYERTVRRLARPLEVQRHVLRKGPKVEIAAGVRRALIDPDRLRTAQVDADPFERFGDVFRPIVELQIDHG